MKNTLFISTYYNNPHFIELQAKTFKKFVEDDFDFTVLDDSTDSVTSILSGNLARTEIRSECEKYNVGYVHVPQSIHAYYSQGGYVPNENETVTHPTERHQAILRWLFKNYKQLGFDQYKTLVLFDADVMFRQPVKMSEFMEYDIIGTGRTQYIDLPLGKFSDAMFSDKVRSVNHTTINFLTFFILFLNLQKINNLETLDVGSWPATDTGSKSNFFIKENPQYTISYLHEVHDSKCRVELVSKNKIIDKKNAELIHYRAGSNWSYENKDYYREKMNRMLNEFIPDFATESTTLQHDLVSRDGEHIIRR
jgi:hypothetical protein